MRLSIKVFYFYFDFVDCFFLIGNIIYCQIKNKKYLVMYVDDENILLFIDILVI